MGCQLFQLPYFECLFTFLTRNLFVVILISNRWGWTDIVFVWIRVKSSCNMLIRQLLLMNVIELVAFMRIMMMVGWSWWRRWFMWIGIWRVLWRLVRIVLGIMGLRIVLEWNGDVLIRVWMRIGMTMTRLMLLMVVVKWSFMVVVVVLLSCSWSRWWIGKIMSFSRLNVETRTSSSKKIVSQERNNELGRNLFQINKKCSFFFSTHPLSYP